MTNAANDLDWIPLAQPLAPTNWEFYYDEGNACLWMTAGDPSDLLIEHCRIDHMGDGVNVLVLKTDDLTEVSLLVSDENLQQLLYKIYDEVTRRRSDKWIKRFNRKLLRKKGSK